MSALTERFARPQTALICVAIQILLIAASFPLAALSHHLNVSTVTAGTVAEFAFTCVGGLIAYRRPKQVMGWIILGVGGLMALSAVGGGYAVLDYRQHGGRLPLG